MSDLNRETRMLIGITEVPYVYWSQLRGKRLKAALGKTPNAEVAQQMQELGFECTRQYVDKIVNGKAKSVSISLLLTICKTFGIDVTDIIPIQVETETKEISL